MRFFVIKHLPTGGYLPAGGKHLGGHTNQGPSTTRPPRLFTKASSASKALGAYTKGKWTESGSWGEYGWEPGGPEPAPKTARNANEFRVVKVDVLEVE